MWVIALLGAAPCQCLTFEGTRTTSPTRISSTALHAADPGGDDLRLAQRTGVPGGSRSWNEAHHVGHCAIGACGLVQHFYLDRARKGLGWRTGYRAGSGTRDLQVFFGGLRVAQRRQSQGGKQASHRGVHGGRREEGQAARPCRPTPYRQGSVCRRCAPTTAWRGPGVRGCGAGAYGFMTGTQGASSPSH